MIKCIKCGCEVVENLQFKEASLKNNVVGVENYKYDCINCDEHMFSFEVEND